MVIFMVCLELKPSAYPAGSQESRQTAFSDRRIRRENPSMHPQLDNRIRTRLRLRHLELLDALGDTLNIHHAAPRLNLSQPATSKLLQEVEELYRTSLFERHARGLRPTAAGETAIRWARLLLHEAGESLAETHLVASGASGRVRVGALAVAIPTLFHGVLAEASASMPKLVVSLLEAPLETLLPALQRKELDVVLARLTADTQHASFTSEPLYSERVALVVRPSHRLLKKRQVQPADLAELDWILPLEFAPMRQELERSFVARGLPRPRARIETSSLLLIETALGQTDMIAAMPQSVAQQYGARGQLQALCVDIDIDMPPVGIVTRAGDVRAPLVECFLDLVRGAASAIATIEPRRSPVARSPGTPGRR
jgi:DNA-binding transcriptional LysR family regulator